MSRPWPFTGYEKIPESPEQWGLDEGGFRALKKASWVVTEKIHGANFCFVSDGAAVRCANRRAFLSEGDSFFGHERLLGRLHGTVLGVAAALGARRDARRVCVYGELFGGAYPHPGVPPDPAVQPVQTGVYYAPGIEFCAFDIALEQRGDAAHKYLEYDTVLSVCRSAGLLVAEPLFVGSYGAALDYPVGFNSTIPQLLGLPPLPDQNLAEGVVIKPVQPLVLAGAKGPVRPVIKKKIAAFAEDSRYSGAQKWPTGYRRGDTGDLDSLQWAAAALVTANRVRNAISKIGRRQPRDGHYARRLFRLVVEDVLEQAGDEPPDALGRLTEQERAQLTRFVGGEVRALLREMAREEAL